MSALEILEIFEDLFVETFAGKPEVIQTHRCFSLTEDAPEAKLKKVEIRDIPEHSVLLKTQNCPPTVNVFKSNKGECKMCDYILITSYKKDLYFIFIEMKSQKRDNRDIIPQLKGGSCFMKYCAAILEAFHDVRISHELLKTRNIVFHVPLRLRKTPTHINNMKKSVSISPTFPVRIIRIPVYVKKEKAFIYFERLVFDMPDDIRNA